MSVTIASKKIETERWGLVPFMARAARRRNGPDPEASPRDHQPLSIIGWNRPLVNPAGPPQVPGFYRRAFALAPAASVPGNLAAIIKRRGASGNPERLYRRALAIKAPFQ
jgi:hypothetical protein